MKKTLLLYLFSILFSSLEADIPPPTETGHFFVADYVIIGAGSSGTVLAKMLSHDKKHSVLLLESQSLKSYTKAAVNPPGAHSITPLPLEQNTQFFWYAPTNSGKALTEVSSIQDTIWIRGSNQSYSKWKQFGGKKWSTQRINKIFKHLEKYSGKSRHIHSRGSSGPINIRQSSKITPTGSKFSSAVHQALKFPILSDYNDPKTPIGIAPLVQWTQIKKDRKHPERNLQPFLNDHIIDSEGMGTNGRLLQVLYKTTAINTIWKGNTAIGVRTLKSGEPLNIYARKKIIVCAGINSSKFLLLSGIGLRDTLNALEIPIKFNNKFVGGGLRDNPIVTAIFSTNLQDSGKGLGTIAPFYAFLPDPTQPKSHTRAIQLAGQISSPGILTVGMILSAPKSRGAVRLTSHDPLEKAVVDLQLLSDNADLTTYIKAFRQYLLPIAEKLAQIDPSYQLLTPSPAVIANDALLTTYIKGVVGPSSALHNYTSHCRMAPFKLGGVVNGIGKVHGVRNLHVADCSIAPTSMERASTAMAYMIAMNIALQLIQTH